MNTFFYWCLGQRLALNDFKANNNDSNQCNKKHKRIPYSENKYWLGKKQSLSLRRKQFKSIMVLNLELSSLQAQITVVAMYTSDYNED